MKSIATFAFLMIFSFSTGCALMSGDDKNSAMDKMNAAMDDAKEKAEGEMDKAKEMANDKMDSAKKSAKGKMDKMKKAAHKCKKMKDNQKRKACLKKLKRKA